MTFETSAELGRTLKNWNERLGDALKDAQRETSAFIGKFLGERVSAAIRDTTDDPNGFIFGLQRMYVGSGGGYAAWRANHEIEDVHGINAGWLTNSINNGHAGRYRGTSFKRHLTKSARASFDDHRVQGRFFYDRASAMVNSQYLTDLVEREILEPMCQKLNGEK